MTRTRRPSLSSPATLALGIAAIVLFLGGIYLGFRYAEPPPAPDLSRLGAPVDPPAERPEKPPEGPAKSKPSRRPPPPLEIARQPAPGPVEQPRIALIIDDLGRSLDQVEALAELRIPLTYSVLPFESQTPQVVGDLRQRGVDFMCHLPMEAKNDHADPGPGALLLSMSRRELRRATRRALEATAGAVGVNNHMGSAISPERGPITTVLKVIREMGLFYVDSRTSADTLGYSVARQLGIPAAERQVFLDTEVDTEVIRSQFDSLLAIARERGGAIAIGHPHAATLAVLSERIPAAQEAGFEFVAVRELLN